MIVDFRIRPATKSIVAFASLPEFEALFEWLGGAPPEEDPATTIAQMDKADIGLAVVQGRDLETTFGFRVPNEEIAEFVGAYPERLVGLAGIDPNKGRGAIGELERCIDQFGFLGASVDPYMHRMPLDDHRMWPLYEYCESKGLIVNLTSGPGPLIENVEIADAAPYRLDSVANRFPNLTIVLSHGGYPWVTQAIAMAMRHERVFIEASVYETMPGAEPYRNAANGVLRQKMLFASAHPYARFEDRIEVYRSWDMDPEAFESVMSLNGSALIETARANVARGK